jgi:hypothetical protein
LPESLAVKSLPKRLPTTTLKNEKPGKARLLWMLERGYRFGGVAGQDLMSVS